MNKIILLLLFPGLYAGPVDAETSPLLTHTYEDPTTSLKINMWLKKSGDAFYVLYYGIFSGERNLEESIHCGKLNQVLLPFICSLYDYENLLNYKELFILRVVAHKSKVVADLDITKLQEDFKKIINKETDNAIDAAFRQGALPEIPNNTDMQVIFGAMFVSMIGFYIAIHMIYENTLILANVYIINFVFGMLGCCFIMMVFYCIFILYNLSEWYITELLSLYNFHRSSKVIFRKCTKIKERALLICIEKNQASYSCKLCIRDHNNLKKEFNYISNELNNALLSYMYFLCCYENLLSRETHSFFNIFVYNIKQMLNLDCDITELQENFKKIINEETDLNIKKVFEQTNLTSILSDEFKETKSRKILYVIIFICMICASIGICIIYKNTSIVVNVYIINFVFSILGLCFVMMVSMFIFALCDKRRIAVR